MSRELTDADIRYIGFATDRELQQSLRWANESRDEIYGKAIASELLRRSREAAAAQPTPDEPGEGKR